MYFPYLWIILDVVGVFSGESLGDDDAVLF